MQTREAQVGNTKLSYYKKASDSEVVLFVHGNGSNKTFWKEIMVLLGDSALALAPDLRGYGNTQGDAIKAENSYGDFIDDLLGLLKHENVSQYHVVSHSLGGGICWELLVRDNANILSMTQVNPASPFGFGGTKTMDGELTYPNGEGSGGGIVNLEFVKLLQAKDKTTNNQASPLNVMNAFYWNPPFVPKNIDELLDSVLSMHVSDTSYPGDFEKSENYPFTKPGKFGQLNAASPVTKQNIVKDLVSLKHKPKIYWVRGAKDQIVSDNSMFDLAVHGAAGLIPNYPGVEVCPPQPMVAQTRYVLEEYAKEGGEFEEIVYENAGHSPFIEEPARFVEKLKKTITS